MGGYSFGSGGPTFNGIPLLASGGLIPLTMGKIFWVDSAGSSGSVPTLAAAYTSCVTSRGDVIVMKAGHAETIATNTALTLNKIGVTIVGLGQGAHRPVITLTGTTSAATITVSGASQTFKNFIVTSGVAELIAAFTVSAVDCTFDGIEYRETNATYTILSAITGTAGADYLTIKNCKFKSITTSAAPASCIVGVAAMNDVVIQSNIIEWIGSDNAATCAIYNAGAGLRWTIAYNIFKVTGGTSVTVVNATTCTGMAIYNSSGTAGTTLASNFQFDGGYSVQNLVTDTVNTQGIPDPILVT